MITFTSKQPYEAYTVSFDFSAALGVETIASAIITAADRADGADVSTVVLDVTQQALTATVVYGWVRAGESGHSYLITCRIIGSLGSLYELEGILPVVETPAEVTAPATLADFMTADLSTFYSPNDFAVSATLTVGAVVTTVNVIFSAPFSAMSPATGQIETTQPEARCNTSDVSAAVHGSSLVIGGTTYYVIGVQPTEDNLETVLILSKDRP